MRHPNDTPTRVTISVPIPSEPDEDAGTTDVLQRAVREAEQLAADLIGPEGLCLQQVGGYTITSDDDGAWLTITTAVR